MPKGHLQKVCNLRAQGRILGYIYCKEIAIMENQRRNALEMDCIAYF
jgi:hypothetical protein